MPTSSSHSPRRKRVRRSASSLSASRWGPRSLSPSAQRPASSRTTTSFLFSPDSGSDREELDHDSGLEDDASFAVLQPSALRAPLAYSSLPPTPISTSPFQRRSPTPPSSTHTNIQAKSIDTDAPQFSLWDYLREELLATDFDSHQEHKWERVSNFLSMPVAIEKISIFGFILCLDSFLYTFTILPIRFTLAFGKLLYNTVVPSSSALPPSQKADILRALLLVASLVILSPLTDASKIYHSIRGQDTIKLYVIFNALEIADRLCGAIGQDIIDSLFSRSTLEVLSHRKWPTQHTLRPLFFFILALIYTVSHSLVMVYQMISLNVAINSYDNSLLTLLVSNQFVEIKGSVFKKFEKDNLFQITCADIVERFTLALMLVVVAFRNLIELSGSSFNFSEGFALPKSFGWLRGNSVLWTVSYPVISVMISEMLVDWLKHAFITKFNHIRPSVYERYTDVLCRDLASASGVSRRGNRKHTYVDQSPLVARRLGFASLPLAVLVILIGSQTINLLLSMHTEDLSPWSWNVAQFSEADWINVVKWLALGCLFWLCFVGLKLIMGIQLLSYATRRRAGMEDRAAADVVNDFGRDPIGEGKEEQKYNRDLKTILDHRRDNAAPVAEIGELGQEAKEKAAAGGDKKKKVPLEEITRYTMVKRIW
ncbi:eukaryotic membrane protein family-domain-containing protein [Cytidiella melzeri]|nr:eukaryotic membrane protein family-domain-containing protein [Cytidiella melzeri]